MAFDITDDVALVAVVPAQTAPVTGDFSPAEWVATAPTSEQTTIGAGSTEYRYVPVTGVVDGVSSSSVIRFLVDTTSRPQGIYDVHIDITDNPEHIRRKVGVINVT